MLLQNRFLLHFLPKHNCQKLAIFGIKSSMNNWRAISCNKICKYLYLCYQKHAPARDFASSIFSRKCIYLFFSKKSAVMFYWRAAGSGPFLGNMKGAKITILLAALKHFSYENNFVGLFTKNSFFSLAASSSFQAFSFEISSPKTDFNCTVIKNHEFNYTKFEAAFLLRSS